jgi:hypothetical protein
LRLRRLAALGAVAVLLVACGDDDDVAETGEATSTTTTTALPDEDTTTTAPDDAGLEQLAIWPAADVVFTTPEEAATDFVEQVLGVPAALGEFQQGDARSGEIVVNSPGEGGGATVPRGTLVLRQLGADDGWFVLAATSDVQSFTLPVDGTEVPAGPLTVEAAGRGFEGTVVVSARVAGQTGPPLSQVVAQGGSLADPAPFTVELDLSGADPGETVMLLLQGGVGLETDPGDFAAIPVVIE